MEILDRCIKNLLYIIFSPLLGLSASVWFTPDLIGLALSSFFFGYTSLLLSLFIIWHWSYFSIKELVIIKKRFTMQVFFLILGIILGFFGHFILSLSIFLAFSFLCRSNEEIYKLRIQKSYIILFKELNLILSICFILMLAFLCNPYTKPYLN